MSQFLYNIAIQSYHLAIKIAALWQPKAKAWVAGRADWRTHLSNTYTEIPNSIIWFHCASLGEFEQGRPLMELIKQQQTGQKIVLTFFSPSGYEIRKNYQGADYVYYLPLDTSKNAKEFLEIIQPKLAVFVKYEFWFHFLHTLQKQSIPIYLIGGLFRPQQYFFTWFGKSHLAILQHFTHIFVQNNDSKELLQQHGVTNVSIAGDPRIDRVVQIANSVDSFPIIEQFKNNKPLLVLGSTHPKDITIWTDFFKTNTYWQVLIAPHEVHETAIKQLQQALPQPTLCYTAIKKDSIIPKTTILIVNTIGMLNQLYQYADVVYIGGGFGEGIHNTLEPAVFGVPIVIGPTYEKFEEANTMVKNKGIEVVQKSTDIQPIMTTLQDLSVRKELGKINQQYLVDHKGGTEKVYGKIFS